MGEVDEICAERQASTVRELVPVGLIRRTDGDETLVAVVCRKRHVKYVRGHYRVRFSRKD